MYCHALSYLVILCLTCCVRSWGLATLLEAYSTLSITSPRTAQYQDILARLVPYPTSANGYDIGENIPLAPDGHRHYSHLFMVYPLSTLNLSQASNYELATKSIDWWTGRPQRSHYEVSHRGSAVLLCNRPWVWRAIVQ